MLQVKNIPSDLAALTALLTWGSNWAETGEANCLDLPNTFLDALP